MKIIDTTNKIIVPTDRVLPGSGEPSLIKPYTTNGDLTGALYTANNFIKPVRLYRTPPPNYDILLNRLICDLNPGVDPDVDRYNDILRRKAREKLKRFISPEEMIGRRGDKIVSIPVPHIKIPKLRRGSNSGGNGIGQGDGQIGQPITGSPQPGPGQGAGGDPDEHIREEFIPMSRSEIAQFLIEDLGLPNLLPKGQHNIKKEGIKWTTKSKVGNDWLLQETVLNALRRAVIEIGDNYNLDDPDSLEAFLNAVVVEDQDMVYQSWTVSEKPETSAVIIYMMDVSGSMTDQQKEWVRRQAWYLSTIIQYSYGQIRADLRNEVYTHDDYGQGIEEVFIIHDAEAKEVSEEVFYTTRESGGTKISSAYQLAEKIIQQRYNPAIWNLYLFHFSDGDNFSDDDNKALDSIQRLTPIINEFGYVQVASPYGSGKFLRTIKDEFENNNIVRTSKIETGDDLEFRQATIDLLKEKEGASTKAA
jgi:uncharacterized protein